MGQSEHDPGAKGKRAWNAGRKLGAKRALKPQQVWAIRFWLDSKARMRDRAMFDLAIDSKLRGCDVVKIRIGGLVLGERVRSRAIVVQQKTKRPVQFEMLDHAQGSLRAWLERRGGAVTDYVFPSRIDHAKHIKAAAETITTVAADPKHLGARLGLTAVLHTWGSALTHHPHVHMIVPGGGLSPDGTRWIACRPGFFLPVRVLSRLFRRLFLDGLVALHEAGRLAFFGEVLGLAERDAFAAHLAPLRKAERVVYAKRPFGGPEAVLAYLSRYTHRVAISNSRLIGSDDGGVTFRWKDYRARGRAEAEGWIKTMTLEADEFIRRFLIHVLPNGFHRIRHYGLLASGTRAASIARARELLTAAIPGNGSNARVRDGESNDATHPCPCCSGRMIVIETFERGCAPRSHPTAAFRIDSS